MPDNLIFVSVRKAAVSHLKNGGFLDLPRQYTAINNYRFFNSGMVNGITKVFRTLYRYLVTDSLGPSTAAPIDIPGCLVQAAAPVENFFAYWDVWGSEGLVGVDVSGRSLDGGHRLDVHFAVTGKIYFKQAVESFDKFRGKPVTVALTGYFGKGDVKVTLGVDSGTPQSGRPFYSRYFGPYTRMVQPFEIPTNATKFEVLVTLEGARESFVSLSGAMLAIGAYTADLPFSENPSDKAIPSGTIVAWAGDNCPSGYRSVGDEVYLLQTVGDPNDMLGDLSNTKTRRKQVIGDNRHDHAAGSASERQPSAFDLRGDSFVTATVEQDGAPNRDVEMADSAKNGDATVYEGVREKVLPMEHTHLIKITDELVESPRIKVRICEKI